MKRVRSRAVILVVLALLLLGARGRCEWPVAAERVYALAAESSLVEGCFPPLRCPVAISEFLGGTFRLERRAAGQVLDVYAVRDVFWLARFGGEDVPITGSGTFFDGLLHDRLALDLRIGDREAARFDSGFVPTGPFGAPEIDLTISINGERGFDTAIAVRALAFAPPTDRMACGPTGLTCDPATEVCVARTPIGPAIVHSCEAVPAGCDADRTCGCAGAALCTGGFDRCTELGENELQCECERCQ